MRFLKTIGSSLLQLFYPAVCAGCGSDAVGDDSQLCAFCLQELPVTGFENHSPNPIETLLMGRVGFQKATAQFYFSKESLLQHLIHQVKYQGNQLLGRQLGVIIGNQLKDSNRFEDIDVLLPLPLFEKNEWKRGYNQSRVLCQGIQEVLQVPIVDGAVLRPSFTESQTRKNRTERWQNMAGKFLLSDASKIEHAHVLLVDDVITTGATLESCAIEILKAPGATVSIATLCFAGRF